MGDDLVEEVHQLRAAIADHRRALDDLEARLRRLDEWERAADGALDAAGAAPRSAGRPIAPDRRQLLGRAAGVATGALAGALAGTLLDATPAAAASGTFDGNPAVTGTANPTSGIGIFGTSTSGTGVQGNAGAFGVGVRGSATSNGTGVRGASQSGYGVYGSAVSGVAVAANCTTGTALYGFSSSATGLDVSSVSGSAIDAYVDEAAVHVRLGGAASPPPSTAYARIAGSIVCDTNGDLWYCVASGTPGTWRKVSGAGTAGALHILPTPVRVYDSRPGYLPNIGTKAPLAGNTPRPCDLKANGSGVPAGATAALISLTATNTAGSGGFLAVYRAGIAWPGTSNLNWSAPNQNVAVTTVTALDGDAFCSLYANLSTNVVVDVLGYFR